MPAEVSLSRYRHDGERAFDDRKLKFVFEWISKWTIECSMTSKQVDYNAGGLRWLLPAGRPRQVGR